MAHIASYSHLTIGTVPADAWDEAWFALQSWKGYLQSLPGFMAVRIGARALNNGDVRLLTTTVWAYPEHLESWRESHWSARTILEAISRPIYDVVEETLEDFA